MSLRRGPWGLRFLALALAILIWFIAGFEKREQQSEKVIEASVTYSPPPGLIILDPVQKVRVRVQGRTSRIRTLNPFAVDVLIALPAASKGPYEVQIRPENVVLPEDLQVISIEPNELRLLLDREATQLLPVKARLIGEPAAGAMAKEVRVIPDRVTASGPESRLRDIKWLTTSNVNLNGHAFDFDETVAVLAPDPLVKVLQPSVVTVHVPMQPPALAPPRAPAKDPG